MPDLPDHTVTLNDLLQTEAAKWHEEGITPKLIEMLRSQRERWNTEQAIGSRKRVTSKQVSASKPAGKTKKMKGLSLEGLKL